MKAAKLSRTLVILLALFSIFTTPLPAQLVLKGGKLDELLQYENIRRALNKFKADSGFGGSSDPGPAECPVKLLVRNTTHETIVHTFLEKSLTEPAVNRFLAKHSIMLSDRMNDGLKKAVASHLEVKNRSIVFNFCAGY